MKIVVTGATGTIGKHIVAALEGKHEIIKVGLNNGDYQVDITDPASIHAAFEQIGAFDALINASGDVAFNQFEQLTQDEWQVGLSSKLMGQVNLAQAAVKYLNQGGSITLTSGIIADYPIAYGVSAATINGAVQHFVKAAATEMPNNIRINVVSPTLLTDSIEMYGDHFPGFHAADGKIVAQSYVRSVLGVETGQTFKVLAGN